MENHHLIVNHLGSKTKYTDLFAASCGSIGDFTDIKLCDEGYAITRQMKHFNFPVRNLDGTFYAQVHPSTHPTLLSRCTQVGPSCSHPITHNSPCYNISLFKLHSWSSQCSSLLTFQSTGLKMMVPCVSMTPTVGKQRRQSHGCVSMVSIPCPTPSKPTSAI